jgi:hypothetical protein
MRQSARVLTSDEVARATAELIFSLQREFPKADLVPCEAVEGEVIHLEVRLPKRGQQLQAAQERALELKRQIEDRYGLYILVRVVPQS